MNFRKLIFFIALLLLQQLTFGQYRFIATIRDSVNNDPLVGATMVVKGTTNGNSADANGIVKINFSQKGKFVLQASFIGYQAKTFNIEIPQKDTAFVVLLTPISNEIEEVTVSSVRTNSTIENIPTKIEVLGLEEVSEENGIKPGNIMSLLGDIAGIQMQQVSASSGNTYARIQGLNGRYTQILKDGLPLFGGMSGGFSIMQIPPLDLKQIEIIKGCGSTLYGADAIGGIINLISKNPTEKQEVSLTLNQTTLLESNINLYAAKKFKKFGYTLFLGETLQKQKDVNGDGLSDVSNVNSFVLHPKLFFYISPKSNITLNYTGTFDRRKGGNMDYFKSPNDTIYHVTNISQRHSADLKWFYEFSGSSNLTLKFSNNFLDEDLNTKYYDFKANQNIYYSELSYFQKLTSTEWVAGVNFNGDIFNKKSTGFTQIENYSYNTFGVFVQNTWNISEKLSLESGFREDYHSEYGFFHLPRLSVMYKFSKQITARVNSGLGYKIPVQFSYIEPETDLNNVVITDLKPERSKGVNADFNYQHSFDNKLGVTFNQAFFFTSISRPIFDSSMVASKISLANADRSLVTGGLQTYLRLNYDEVEFYLGYVYTQVKQNYSSTHKTPVATPKHQFSTTLFYDISEKLVVGIESSYFADQLDQNYKRTKDYLLLAAMVQYNIGNFSFVLNGENLLDFRQSKYEQIYDGTVNNPVFHKFWAPIDGRVINLSVKWKIK